MGKPRRKRLVEANVRRKAAEEEEEEGGEGEGRACLGSGDVGEEDERVRLPFEGWEWLEAAADIMEDR